MAIQIFIRLVVVMFSQILFKIQNFARKILDIQRTIYCLQLQFAIMITTGNGLIMQSALLFRCLMAMKKPVRL